MLLALNLLRVFFFTQRYQCQHYLGLIIPAALRHKPGSVARGRDRARRVPCDDAAWAPLERRSRDAYHGCAKR